MAGCGGIPLACSVLLEGAPKQGRELRGWMAGGRLE